MRVYKNVRTFALVVLLATTIIASAGTDSLPLPGNARYAVSHFGEYFGLSAVTVTSLAQDREGFLWIGTQTGVFRYDGATATHFGRSEGLPSEEVLMLLTAPDGGVWVRTTQGIAHFAQGRFTVVTIPPGNDSLRNVYQSFAVDSRGTLYLSTQSGLLRVNPNSGFVTDVQILLAAPVDAIGCLPDDTIWFAAGSRLGFFRPGSSTPEMLPQLLPELVTSLLPSRDHKLWVRTLHDVGFVNTQAADMPKWLGKGLPTANLMGGPSLDREGNLLLPTCRGLYTWTGNTWKLIDHKNGLTSSAVTAALEDREGGVWIGTAGTGLDYWPGSKQWSGWTDAEGLPDALVLGVVRDRRSRIWVASNTALVVWDSARDRWQNWADQSVGSRGASQILLAPDGAVWALFPGKGVVRFDADSAYPRPQVVPALPGWEPHRIALASTGEIWADGMNSLHRITYQKGHFEVREKVVPSDEMGTTDTVSISPQGAVWISGPKGIARWTQTAWRHFDVADGLPANQARNIRAISDDEAWIGYPDQGAVTRLRLLPGGHVLAKNFPGAVCSLGADAQRNVWLEMEDGLGVVSPDNELTTFTQKDGLLWDDINCDTLWQEPDGSLLIGTSKGLVRYDPSQPPPQYPRPTVVLTSMLLGKTDRLAERDPQVNYNDRTLLATFAAPNFHDSNHTTCRYRLRGLETELTETALREVRYPSLPSGPYLFEVSCGSAAVGWSNPRDYAFSIRAPWWDTWWFRLAAVALMSVLIWAVVQYRMRRIIRERQHLETAVAERSAELATANRALQEISLRDHLTGVRNRRFFESMISADASQALRAHNSDPKNFSRDHRDLIFYLIDIDHFKEVNDQYGHRAGDLLLVEFARRLGRVVRDSDFLIRWGGEEFLVVCRSAQQENGHITAERILTTVGSIPFDLGDGVVLPKTCSVGWAPFPWSSSQNAILTVEEVLRLADHGLYLAKNRGRNQAAGILPKSAMPRPAGRPYTKLEDLLRDGWIREACMPGPVQGSSSAGDGAGQSVTPLKSPAEQLRFKD